MIRFVDPGGRLYGSVGASNAILLSYWSSLLSFNSAGTFSVSSGTGRVTGSSLRMNYNGGSNVFMYLTKNFEAQSTWGMAFAFKINIAPNPSMQLCAFLDSSTLQVDLRLNGDGTLSVTRNGTVLGTSSISVPFNVWTHVEIKTTIHPTAGAVQVWINSTSRLSLTSVNTRNTANSNASVIQLGTTFSPNGAGAEVWDFDDIIVYDGQTTDGSGNADITGPVGDCSLSVLLPTGAGNSTQFTPDSGSNYARVNETTPDTTSYVESSTVGNTDTYALADLPANISSVKAVVVANYAEKTDVGARQIGTVIRSGATNFTHSSGIDLTTAYLYNFRSWGTNPQTVLPWTVSDVNALEAGQAVNT